MIVQCSNKYQKDSIDNLLKKSAVMEKKNYKLVITEGMNCTKDMNSHFYAFKDNHLIGYLNIFAPTPLVAEIQSYVHYGHRRRGVFKNLLSYAIEELKKYKIPKIVCVVHTESNSGKICLEHMGLSLKYTEYEMHYDQGISQDHDGELIAVNSSNIDTYMALAYAVFGQENALNKASILNENSKSYIYKREGPCGIVTYNSDGVMYGLGIRPEDQGKKFAQDLLSLSVQSIYDTGIKTVSLEVDSLNKIAFSLYKNFGFKIVEQFDYYERKDKLLS